MLQITWRVVRVLSHDTDSGEILAVVESFDPKKRTTVPVKAWGFSAAGWKIGETLDCEGEWVAHPKHSRVFKVKKHIRRTPVSDEDAAEYLATNVKSLSRAVASEILAEVGGLDAFREMVVKHRERLYDLECLKGRKSLVRRINAINWDGTEIDPDLLGRLRQAGLNLARMRKIVRHFGNIGTRERISTAPYSLCEVPGIGFATAEAVANHEAERRGEEFNPLDPDRLMYGLVWTIGQQRGQGHICLPHEVAYRHAARVMKLCRVRNSLPLPEEVSKALIEARDRGTARKMLVDENSSLYSASMWRAEKEVADNLRRLINMPASLSPAARIMVERRLKETRLSEEQRAAVLMCLSNRVTCLTGGPGVGKTSTLDELVKVIKALGKQMVLAAPTGKAAKRMQEVTGEPASTIHRLLNLQGSPEQNDDEDSRDRRGKGKVDYLRADFVIIDESSMIDLLIIRELLRRIKSGTTQVVFVGDENQLAPVGPGEPFRDILHCGHVAVARLTKVFRQAGSRDDGGGIVAGAYRLNQGELPMFDEDGPEVRLYDPSKVKSFPTKGSGDDVNAWVGEKVLDWLVKAPAWYHKHTSLDQVREMQVLAPMNKGPLGVVSINNAFQAAFNPGPAVPSLDVSVKIGGAAGRYIARVGDKVMQTKNDYDRGVTNGQLGYITRIDGQKKTAWVQFDGAEEEAKYETAEHLSQLSLAYCYSIHRSQGSECPVVLLVVDDMHSPMLYRQLIYTGWTRAKKCVAVFGRLSALQRAARETQLGKRYGHLPARIEAALGNSKRRGLKRAAPSLLAAR